MAEAMTNSEIEDVLTSIRRLVSQEVRRSEAAALAPVPAGRLVLTPAQRVDEPAPPVPTALELPAPDFGALEATIAELEAAVSASGGSFEPDGSEGAGTPAGTGPGGATVTELHGKLGIVRRAVSARRQAAGTGIAPVASPATVTVVPPAPPAPPPQAAATAPRVAPDATPAGDDDDTVETVIDEAMLRAIVRDLVHEVLDEVMNDRIRKRARMAVRRELEEILREAGLR